MQSSIDSLESTCQIGIDEAGRGPLLGPVCAAAVLLPDDRSLFTNIKDSKKYSSYSKLEAAAKCVISNSKAFGVGWATVEEIDRCNIRVATHSAMHRAVRELISKLPSSLNNPHLLVDGNDFTPFVRNIGVKFECVPHTCVIKGDSTYLQIAAASVIAKYERDEFIKNLASANPVLSERYMIDSNKGYGTRQHIAGIERYGLCDHHRKTFGICKRYSSPSNT